MASQEDIARYSEQVRPEVINALASDDIDDALADLAELTLALAYDQLATEDSTQAFTSDDVDAFVASLDDVIEVTTPDSDPEAVTAWIVRAALNAATVAAAPPDATMTWRTMRDDRVRDIHTSMEGVSAPVGSPFIVGGFPLMYPGQPVGPPEVWANCRCSLDASVEAVTAASDKPWSNFSSSDYTIEQWRRACLLKMPGGDPESKSTYKLPVKEPTGALNRNGVHAAAAALAGARGGVDAPAEAKARARAKLRGLYRQLGEEVPDSLKADADSLLAWPKSTSPPGTHDGPGWATHPRDTQRLRNYWVHGKGAAKIGWGTPNDLTRCQNYLRKYVGPYAWGTCQNMHKEALGIWNPESRGRGRRAAVLGSPIGRYSEGEPAMTAATTHTLNVSDLTAAAPALPPRPKAWFEDPHLPGPTPLAVQADGRVFGHLATWGTCHVGIEGRCVEPPRSKREYAYFMTGEVETDDGPVRVGSITMDTGHAPDGVPAGPSVRHYDDTGTAVADVAAGEDDHGIWIAGAMRPGVSEQQMYALRATGALSGDWRKIAGNLELVAALAVNVPGFPIPRASLAASAANPDDVVSLTAAGVVTDPNADDMRVAAAVVHLLDARSADAARRERASALAAEINDLRVGALTAALEG